MTTDDWVRERAERVTVGLIGDHSDGYTQLIAAALREAEERARASERAHALEGQRLAHRKQEEAVAAERERCAKVAESVSGVLPGGNWDYGVNMPGKIAAAIRAATLADTEGGPDDNE